MTEDEIIDKAEALPEHFADRLTESMRRAIDETYRRRATQQAHNEAKQAAALYQSRLETYNAKLSRFNSRQEKIERQEEIDLLVKQQKDLDDHIASARLRLDAIRLIDGVS